MNPYLEQDDVWGDFHQALIPDIRDELTTQLRPHYIVKIEHRLYIHELPEDQWRLFARADVAVADQQRTSAGSSTATLSCPAFGRVPLAIDVERQAYLEIRDRASRELVAVIEVLSPSNKLSGPDREQYLAKRNQLLLSNVHLVEIDLLRGGPRLPVQDLPECDYFYLVSRADVRPKVELWPFRLADPLPLVPVPVHAGRADATVNLKALLDTIYDRAGYADYIYQNQPQPPLNAEQATWARPFIPTPD
jgi:hypothetical protein